ncbi:MAG: hypothetical protein V3W37_03035 [Candidatus Binatia bacterium]
MSEDRSKSCKHGTFLHEPCKGCKRTESSIMLAAVLGDLVDEFKGKADCCESHEERWSMFKEIEDGFETVRTKHFGERE